MLYEEWKKKNKRTRFADEVHVPYIYAMSANKYGREPTEKELLLEWETLNKILSYQENKMKRLGVENGRKFPIISNDMLSLNNLSTPSHESDIEENMEEERLIKEHIMLNEMLIKYMEEHEEIF